jgi:ferric-dicitrate binding protein FerR (iron transport regulator)
MNANDNAAEIRASDADRDAALSELSEHFQAGRLTAAEFDDRAGQALTARTWGELRILLRDLPAPTSAATPQRPSRRPAMVPLAAIGIAAGLLVGVAYGWWSLWLVAVVLFVARRYLRGLWTSGDPRTAGL